MKQPNGDFICGQDGPISEAAQKEITYFKRYLTEKRSAKAAGRAWTITFKDWHAERRNADPASERRISSAGSE